MALDETPSSHQMEGLTVFIIDDHPLFCRGLKVLIETDPDLSVCGQAASGQDALKAMATLKKQLRPPDLAIVDLEMPGGSGIDLVREIVAQYPDTPSLVISMHDESLYAERSIRAGARGYVSKQELDHTVLDAIHCILAGEIFLSRKTEARFAKNYLGGRTLTEDSPLTTLSNRELEVFRLIGRGKATRQIAEQLNLSVKTIESHRQNLKQKLTIQSATELVQRACQWVETGEV